MHVLLESSSNRYLRLPYAAVGCNVYMQREIWYAKHRSFAQKVSGNQTSCCPSNIEQRYTHTHIYILYTHTPFFCLIVCASIAHIRYWIGWCGCICCWFVGISLYNRSRISNDSDELQKKQPFCAIHVWSSITILCSRYTQAQSRILTKPNIIGAKRWRQLAYVVCLCSSCLYGFLAIKCKVCMRVWMKWRRVGRRW